MKNIKNIFVCQQCGVQHAKWQGKCDACNTWNTIVEEVVQGAKKKIWQGNNQSKSLTSNKPQRLVDIKSDVTQRIVCIDQELNRVLGGGIVPGSLILLGGEPGIGKSTILLQLALSLKEKKVLYVSGEESEQQIKMRAMRIENEGNACYIYNETVLETILQQIEKIQPAVLIIDSMQTLYTQQLDASVGSVGQVRACATELMHYAKARSMPIFVIGHITKEGALAGPKVLEHIVDTVLQFEGDRHLSYRLLRTIKNRFGSTDELGIYEMSNNGLRAVTNPSELLLSQHTLALSGMAVGTSLEGNRPLLIETQALVSPATYGTPQRSTTGFDVKRLHMLLAVLEKRAGFRLSMQDVFLNIAGGLKIDDPSIDLAVCMALVSSLQDVVIPNHICFAAEVGLSGEIRAVNRIESRIAEAARLGFKTIFIAKNLRKELNRHNQHMDIQTFDQLEKIIENLF